MKHLDLFSGIIGHEFDQPRLFISYWAMFAIIAIWLIAMRAIAWMWRKWL